MVNQGGESSEFTRNDVVVLVSAVVGIAGLLFAFLTDWSDTKLIFGETGTIASLAAVAGVGGALFAGGAAYLSYRQSQKAEVATRFQKGAELLMHPLTGIAGVAILDQVASEEPRTYYGPVMRTLANFVNVNEYGEGPYEDAPDDFDPDNDPGTDTKMATIEALLTIGRIRNRVPLDFDPKGDHIDGRYPVTGINLTRYGVYNNDMRNLELSGVTIRAMHFRVWDLRNTILQGTLFHNTLFEACNLAGAELTLLPWGGADPTPRYLRFSGCTGVETARLNRRPLAEYLLQWPNQG